VTGEYFSVILNTVFALYKGCDKIANLRNRGKHEGADCKNYVIRNEIGRLAYYKSVKNDASVKEGMIFDLTFEKLCNVKAD
jgi:hypothetical protein